MRVTIKDLEILTKRLVKMTGKTLKIDRAYGGSKLVEVYPDTSERELTQAGILLLRACTTNY